MVASQFVKARLADDLKERVKAISQQECLSESAWLKRLILRELSSVGGPHAEHRAGPSLPAGSALRSTQRVPGRANRVYVRLSMNDALLLEARAAARGMRSATYLSVLARCHLRALAPLPKEELLAMKRLIGELAAIGRNLNQIARAANEGAQLSPTPREEFRAMLRVCEALRDSTKSMLKANVASWEER